MRAQHGVRVERAEHPKRQFALRGVRVAVAPLVLPGFAFAGSSSRARDEPLLPPGLFEERLRVGGRALHEPEQEFEHTLAHLRVRTLFEQAKKKPRGGGVDDPGDAPGRRVGVGTKERPAKL